VTGVASVHVIGDMIDGILHCVVVLVVDVATTVIVAPVAPVVEL
jgi:hypothetical protein